jgi:predicted Zn-dependent protease
MSAAQVQQIGAVAGNLALANNAENQQMFNQYYGVGTQLGVMLPFSRNHESEADKIGLTLMAIAGYEPLAAADLWRRMKANSDGSAPAEFMSTHPSNDTRINNITAWADDARAEARKFGVSTFKSK